jgi:hypothetical protein
VRNEISKKLKTAETLIQQLGMERETPEKQSAYLLDLASRFQKNVMHALEAKYGRSDLFDDDPILRLATAVTARNASFGTEVNNWGQEYQFSSVAENQAATQVGSEELKIRKVVGPPELDEILHPQEDLPGCRNECIIEWLKNVYLTSRGFELGTFDSSILATTMKAQSSKWTKLALGYVSDIVSITHTFIKKLLVSVCVDERVTRELLSTLSEGLIGRYNTAMEHARFLLNVERIGTPITLNTYFSENLEKW